MTQPARTARPPECRSAGAAARVLRGIAFTGGRNVPSARFRVRQNLPQLRELGIEIVESYPAAGAYPPAVRVLRPFWAALSLAQRAAAIASAQRHDFAIIHKSMLSGFVTLEPWVRGPRIFDVDDAIFEQRGGGYVERLAGMCELVVCGNAFLAEWISRHNPRTVVVPTAVDTERFHPLPRTSAGAETNPVVGWIGSGSNLPYLHAIEAPLRVVLQRFPDAVLRVVADQRPRFQRLPEHRVEFVPWSVESEVRAIQEMSVGLMPLDDTAWSRGKCSYKMLQYMACAVPCVVSPVGMNAEVLALGGGGIGARSTDEWVDGIAGWLASGTRRTQAGAEGRALVVDAFSIPVVAAKLAAAIRSTCG
ncbi:MAG: glycosyltransferase family 4 protein [Burkholderiales bacterium]